MAPQVSLGHSAFPGVLPEFPEGCGEVLSPQLLPVSLSLCPQSWQGLHFSLLPLVREHIAY